MAGTVLLIVLLAVLALSGYAMYRWVVVPGRRAPKYVVSQEFSPDEIVREQQLARLLGQASRGPAGFTTGWLVLSTDRLWFYDTGTESARVDVPLDTVTGTELAPEYLGVDTGRPLLVVRFGAGAETDSVGFHLPYPDEWRLAIDNLRPA